MKRISVSVTDDVYEELRVRAFHERVAVAVVVARILESVGRVSRAAAAETMSVAPKPEPAPEPVKPPLAERIKKPTPGPVDPLAGVLRKPEPSRTEVTPRFKGK